MKKSRMIALSLLGGCTLLSVTPILSSCGDTQSNKTTITFEIKEGNPNYLLNQSNPSLTVYAKVFENNEYNVDKIVKWDIPNLDTNLFSHTIKDNTIDMVLHTGKTINQCYIPITAYYNQTKFTKNIKVEQYTTPIHYDYSLSLNVTDQTISNETPISITATTSENLNSNIISWNTNALPAFLSTNVVQSTNSSTLTISLNPQYGYLASDICAINVGVYNNNEQKSNIETLTLTINNWEKWKDNFIPRTYLNIDNGVLKGFKQSIIEEKYDTLYIPWNVTKINNGAFIKNYSTTIPNNIKTLRFFPDVDEDQTNAINRNLKSIGNSSFETAPFINEIKLPSNITNIGTYAFAHSNIIGIDTSNANNLKQIEEGAFSECGSITKIKLNEGLEELASAKGAGLGCFDMGAQSSHFSGTLTIPSTLKKIGNSAFSGLGYGLSPNTITINWNGNTVLQSIDSNAFYLVQSSTMDFPDSVTNIGNNALYGNKLITAFEVKSNVNTLGTNALEGCSNLKILTLNKYYDYPKDLLRGTAIDSTNPQNCHIYVPAILLEQYKKAPSWFKYMQLFEPIVPRKNN